MKNILYLFGILLPAFSCHKQEDGNMKFREEMRAFVIGISKYAKSINPDFQIIPQNGIELVSSDGNENGPPHVEYLNAINGNGQEDLFYGYTSDNEQTPTDENVYLRSFLDMAKNTGKVILVTDYCSSHDKITDSYTQNKNAGYVSFAANRRELDNIPNYPLPIFEENGDNIISFSQVKNFLYLLNSEDFATKADFIDAITSTNYDLLIMDLFFNDGTPFTPAEISQLKSKATGGTRLVVSYMSIGEAENYRYYWQTSWDNNSPSWMDSENPDWEGNYKVKYWNKDWQSIIFGNDSSYLKKILDTAFDGVYLDIIDAYEYYE